MARLPLPRPPLGLLPLRLASGLVLAGSATLAVPSPAAAGQGDWQWPLEGGGGRPTVVSGFDPPQHRWQAGHRGVDLHAAEGADVLSAGDGVVAFAGLVAGRPVVAVQHGPLRTTYEPVRPGVRVGETVPAGARLGSLSRTGSHCAPLTCLHWGLRRGEEYLDPLRLVGQAPPRLLPLGAPAAPLHQTGARAAPAPPTQAWAPAGAQARGHPTGAGDGTSIGGAAVAGAGSVAAAVVWWRRRP